VAVRTTINDRDIRFHLEKDGRFLCDDKHADETWWGAFDDTFLCRFDTVGDAERTRWRHFGKIRVSIDGELV
jgi:hypothetical protein